MTWAPLVLFILAVVAAVRSMELHGRDCKIHIWERIAYVLFTVSAFIDHLAR